jgi:large subunit ribosomal protein L4
MSTVDVIDAKGEKSGSVDLPAEIFDVTVNVPLMHQVVVAQLAAARQGTHSTKTRGEVRGGGRKPYRQKGTGRARQGSTRAPQFTGGGIVHGPTPRDYSQRTPKKMKAAALRAALSDRARGGRVHVLAGLVDGDVPSTKSAVAVLTGLTLGRRTLVVASRSDEVSWKSLRNVPSVHLLDPGQLNTYDVLVNDDVVFTQAAYDAFVAGGPKGKSVKASARSSEVDAAPATDAGETKPAGEGVSDEEMAEQVESQTDPNLEVEPAFEAEADGASDDGEAAETLAAEPTDATDPADAAEKGDDK